MSALPPPELAGPTIPAHPARKMASRLTASLRQSSRGTIIFTDEFERLNKPHDPYSAIPSRPSEDLGAK